MGKAKVKSKKAKGESLSLKVFFNGMSRTQKIVIFAGTLFSMLLAGRGVYSLARETFHEYVGEMPYANRPELRDTQYVVAGLQQDGYVEKLRQTDFQILQLDSEKKTLGDKFESWKQELLEKLRKEKIQFEAILKEIQQKEKPVKK
jgi:hypothetical protein